MFLCILDGQGNVLLERNTLSNPKSFLKAIAPFREDLVVACECIFMPIYHRQRYWLADLCEREDIAFVLGHALYMRAIHGGKSKNDRLDANKIAVLLRGGMLPQAYVYPKEKRATLGPPAPSHPLRAWGAPKRDLMRSVSNGLCSSLAIGSAPRPADLPPGARRPGHFRHRLWPLSGHVRRCSFGPTFGPTGRHNWTRAR